MRTLFRTVPALTRMKPKQPLDMKSKAALLIILASGIFFFMPAQDVNLKNASVEEKSAFVFEGFENPVPKHRLSDFGVLGPVKFFRRSVFNVNQNKSAPDNIELSEEGDQYFLNGEGNVIEIKVGGGNFMRLINFRHERMIFKYDSNHRLVEVETEIRLDDGTLTNYGMTKFYSYDSLNRLAGMWTKERPEKYLYEYDELGRLLDHIYFLGSDTS